MSFELPDWVAVGATFCEPTMTYEVDGRAVCRRQVRGAGWDYAIKDGIFFHVYGERLSRPKKDRGGAASNQI